MSKPQGPVSTHDWARYVAQAPPGAIAEFGCYDGGSTRVLASFGRPVFAFDTFQGIPLEDFDSSKGDAGNPPGKFTPSATPWELFAGYANVYPIVGRYADTLPQHPGLRFAFAYIDCDLYASYWQVLPWLVARLDGDHFMCDDYAHVEGARKAVDEWLATQDGWEFDGYSVFKRKKSGRSPHDAR